MEMQSFTPGILGSRKLQGRPNPISDHSMRTPRGLPGTTPTETPSTGTLANHPPHSLLSLRKSHQNAPKGEKPPQKRPEIPNPLQEKTSHFLRTRTPKEGNVKQPGPPGEKKQKTGTAEDESIQQQGPPRTSYSGDPRKQEPSGTGTSYSKDP